MSNNKDFKVKNGIQPTVYHEGLGTVVSGSLGYQFSSAYDTGNTLDISSVVGTSPRSLRWKPDGLKLFVLSAGVDTIYSFTLTSPYDLSTVSAPTTYTFFQTEASNPITFHISSDGTKLYVPAYTSASEVHQYTLSTPWDLSSESYDGFLDLTGVVVYGCGAVGFKSDGTKVYVYDNFSLSNVIYQYDLSVAWDVTSTTSNQKTLSVLSVMTGTSGSDITFSPDGLSFLLAKINTSDGIYKYDMSTAWDISTGTLDTFFDTLSIDGTPRSPNYNADGTSLFFIGQANRNIHELSTVLNTASLDLSTGSVFDLTPTSDVQVTLSNPADSGTVSGATLLLDGNSNLYDLDNASYDSKSFSTSSQTSSLRDIAFKPDGTKMYVCDSGGDTAYQYTLSTAWDVSTASYDSVSINVSSKETILSSLTFSSDGTKVYFAGPEFDQVHQYNLSTAWDFNTDSFAGSFSASGTVNLYCVRFSSDGTKMYLGELGANSIYQYSLSSAWDISTASYDSVSLGLRSSTNMYGFDFNSDGTAIYVCSYNIDSVYRMNLSTAWDISTGSDSNVTFSVTGQDTNPTYVRFTPNGDKMYVSGDTNSRVFQYTTESGMTITYDPTLEWPGGTAPTAPANGETDVVTFNTRDGGSTYQGVLASDVAK